MVVSNNFTFLVIEIFSNCHSAIYVFHIAAGISCAIRAYPTTFEIKVVNRVNILQVKFGLFFTKNNLNDAWVVRFKSMITARTIHGNRHHIICTVFTNSLTHIPITFSFIKVCNIFPNFKTVRVIRRFLNYPCLIVDSFLSIFYILLTIQ